MSPALFLIVKSTSSLAKEGAPCRRRVVFEQGAVFQRGKIPIVFAIEREKPLGRDRLIQLLSHSSLFGSDRFENLFVDFAASDKAVRRIKIARDLGRKTFADERFVFLQNVLYFFPPVFFHFRVRISRGKILKRIVLTDEIKNGKGLRASRRIHFCIDFSIGYLVSSSTARRYRFKRKVTCGIEIYSSFW